MRAKLAAILTALVLVGSGSFFGNTNLLNSMALAEEEVVLQETETKAEPETEREIRDHYRCDRKLLSVGAC